MLSKLPKVTQAHSRSPGIESKPSTPRGHDLTTILYGSLVELDVN